MFENLHFSIPLDEERFDNWLIQGRKSKIRYSHIVILWDEMEKDYRPRYLVDRADLSKYIDNPSMVGDVMVAAYDLYTESKIL